MNSDDSNDAGNSIRWHNNNTIKKTHFRLYLPFLIMFPVIGLVIGYFSNSMLLSLGIGLLFILLGIVWPLIALRTKYPTEIGIHKKGLIIKLKNREIKYSWEELNMVEMTRHPNHSLMVEEKKLFGKTYIVENHILRAILTEWEKNGE